MNKPVYISLSVLGISKMVIHEFWYHYVEAKMYEKNQNYVTWIHTAL